ncbi:nucleotidyltransferase domain-containing protein [Neorhizobium tomejilense]|uniref:nucleotidyltransferase domain-containing protein n=1 Tax=Neorhizobium tomejilense TaxID=2093828 RepID=UPI001FDFA6BE|nr:nucleotidyltransferase domain-containing protein [Neorhizobium tomejilense]
MLRGAPHFGAIEPFLGAPMSMVEFMFSVRQQKMLGALLLHPSRQYGTNELTAISGPGSGAGKRVLEKFERAGIVVVTKRGNQRLCHVNTHHPIYSELRSICLKTFGLADVIATELRPFENRIEYAFVFGSLAKGVDRAESDVDLMVVGSVDVFDLGVALENLERAFGRRVDLNLHTPKEWHDLQSDAVVKSIIRAEKIVVITR